ncbi:hypothetical protein AB8B21_05800 [Tardiphaga sp. 866_E4_N2_1]|uniref:hypothetical protein n=1 Tax=unclassified Tardiphaga TaxID=2631404 RepID=UPI003F25D759
MTVLTFILALLKAAPELIALVSRLKASADAKAAQGVGYDQAVADGVKMMVKQLAEINESVEQARAKQAATPGDDGRDTQFRRD